MQFLKGESLLPPRSYPLPPLPPKKKQKRWGQEETGKDKEKVGGKEWKGGKEGKKKKHPSTTAFKTLFIKLKAEKKSSAAH